MGVVKWPVVDGAIPLDEDVENPQKAGGWPFSPGECCQDQWRYVEASGTMEMTPVPDDPTAFQWFGPALMFQWEWPDLSRTSLYAAALLFAQPGLGGWGGSVLIGIAGWPGVGSPSVLAVAAVAPYPFEPISTVPDRWAFRLAVDSLAPNEVSFTIGVGDGAIDTSYTFETTTTLPWILYGQPGPLPEPDTACVFGAVIVDPEAPGTTGSILAWGSGCQPAVDPDAFVLMYPIE